MALFNSIVPFFFIIVTLVVIHELGHFLTAKWFGVKVLEFGIGYPPRIWGKKIGETEYTVNALPLGGFVRLLGEEDPSDPRSLAAQARWKRVVVMAAGSFMNVLLPVLLFAIGYMIPQEVPAGQAQITYVAPGSPAEHAGVKPGDIILAVNGHETENVNEVSYQIRLNQGTDMTWKVRHQLESGAATLGGGGEIVEVSVYGRWAPPKGQGPTGISLGQRGNLTKTQSYPFWEAFPKGLRSTMESLVLARNQVISWIASRSRPEGLAGPVGIAQATGDVVEQAGWVVLLQWAALLSINLAVLNILPLPMLDGGRIFFVIVEWIRGGKRISPEKEALVHFIGFVVLVSFVIVISVFDVMRIFRGESLLR
jgi:regulator of sigma E protease